MIATPCRGCADTRGRLRQAVREATRADDAGLPIAKHVAEIARLKRLVADCALCGVGPTDKDAA